MFSTTIAVTSSGIVDNHLHLICISSDQSYLWRSIFSFIVLNHENLQPWTWLQALIFDAYEMKLVNLQSRASPSSVLLFSTHMASHYANLASNS